MKLIIKLRDIQSIVKNHIHIHYWIKHFAFILKLNKELLGQSKLQDSSQLKLNLLRPSFSSKDSQQAVRVGRLERFEE